MAACLAMSHRRQTPSYKEVGTSVGTVKFIVPIFHYCTVTSCVLYRNATQHIAFFELEVNSCFLDIWKNSCYTQREIACILCSQLVMLDVVSVCAGQLSHMHHKSERQTSNFCGTESHCTQFTWLGFQVFPVSLWVMLTILKALRF